MNPKEALMLCRFIKAACPAQAIDEMTPDAWLVLLEPYRFEDCRQAAIEIARDKPFVAPAEIIARVKAIRADRIAKYGPVEPPPEVERGERDYTDWWVETRTAIADGRLKPQPPRAVDHGQQRRVQHAIEGTFRTVPDA